MTVEGANSFAASKRMTSCFSSIPRFRRHWVTFLPAVMKQGVGLVDVDVDVTNVNEVAPGKRGPKFVNACAKQTYDCNAITINTHNLGMVKCITRRRTKRLLRGST